MRLAALAFVLAACTHQITDYPTQPEMVVGIQPVDTVVLRLTWHQDVDSIAQVCNDARPRFVFYGCAKWVIEDGKSYCTVHAIPPKDFNDIPLLAVLGHELIHCFGARH